MQGGWKFKDYWESTTKKLDAIGAKLASELMWATWQIRNKLKSDNSRPDSNQIIRDILSMVDKFQREDDYQSKRPSENHPSRDCWKPSDRNQWKLNSDAAWFEVSNVGGVG